jgi:hypothetical protein
VKLGPALRQIATIVASSVVLILLGLIYFVATAWIVAFGVDMVRGSPPSSDFVALSAALLTLGSLAGSSSMMGGLGDEEPDEDAYGAEVA